VLITPMLMASKMKPWAITAFIALFLAQTAVAEGLDHSFIQIQRGHHNSVISISTAGGDQTISVSTWHMGERPKPALQLAPKARIIDVQAALANPACTYQNGVCILRLHRASNL
jgi:hypothetical protein